MRSLADSQSVENFLMLRDGPRGLTAQCSACTRLPSGSRAASIGLDSSQRLPQDSAMRDTMRQTSSAEIRSMWAMGYFRPPISAQSVGVLNEPSGFCPAGTTITSVTRESS